MNTEKQKYKIGILTWHYYGNVGSNLQAWAMQHVLDEMGFQSQFINFRKRELDGDRFPKNYVKRLIDSLPFGPSLDTWRFQKDEFRQTKKVYDRGEFLRLCNEFDAIVCGSDQIWAPNVFDSVYMLDGVSDSVRKIAYAASIGLPAIPENLQSTYKNLLSHYYSIGIREEQGRELLHDILGINASAVLDPTFLVSKDDWRLLSKDPSADNPYIFCYFLGEPSRYEEAVVAASRELGLPVVAYLPESGRSEIIGCTTLKKMAVPEFLGWLNNASLVMTDSFHGVALSINLGVEFLAYRRFDDGDDLNQNSRIINILNKFGLENHLLNIGEYSGRSTDWKSVGDELSLHVERSRSFLRQALSDLGRQGNA